VKPNFIPKKECKYNTLWGDDYIVLQFIDMDEKQIAYIISELIIMKELEIIKNF